MRTEVQHTPARERTASVPIGDVDIFEDGSTLINRLYYAVPRFENGRFSCSFFYEENTLRKEPNGDLTLVRSEYGTDLP